MVYENSSGMYKKKKKKFQSVLVDCQCGIGGTFRVKPLSWGHRSNFGSPGIWVVTLLHARTKKMVMEAFLWHQITHNYPLMTFSRMCCSTVASQSNKIHMPNTCNHLYFMCELPITTPKTTFLCLLVAFGPELKSSKNKHFVVRKSVGPNGLTKAAA